MFIYSICREWYHGWRRMSADFAVWMIHYFLQPRAWSWTSCFPPCKFFPFWVTLFSKYCCYYGAKSFICLLLSLFDLHTQHSKSRYSPVMWVLKNVRHPLFHLSASGSLYESLVFISVVYGFISPNHALKTHAQSYTKSICIYTLTLVV